MDKERRWETQRWRIVDWEETGIEDSKYRVNIHNFKLRKKSVLSLSAPLKLMMRDWQSHIDGVGVVKVVPLKEPLGELTRLSPSQHTLSSKLTRTSTS